MEKHLIYQRIMQHVMLFDGGMGTMLQASGLPIPPCPEMLNIQNPEAITAIHRAYAQAGAQILETHTLGANAIALKRHQQQHQAAALTKAGVACVRAASPDALCAVSMGPTGQLLQPLGPLSFQEAYDAYAEQAQAAQSAGADMLILETMGDVHEARIGVLAARENSDLFIIASVTFQPNGRTLMGSAPEQAARVLTAAGAHMLGINCSGGPKELLPCLLKMREASSLPIGVQPNAGLPITEGGISHYPLDAQSFAELLKPILEAGAAAVGGCCGTTPDHIALLAQSVPSFDPPKPLSIQPLLCSSRQCAALHEEAFRLSITDEMPDALYDEVSAPIIQLDLQDAVLSALPAVMSEIQAFVQKPLIFSGDNEAAYAAALHAYHGVAGVRGKCPDALRLKYGAVQL